MKNKTEPLMVYISKRARKNLDILHLSRKLAMSEIIERLLLKEIEASKEEIQAYLKEI